MKKHKKAQKVKYGFSCWISSKLVSSVQASQSGENSRKMSPHCLVHLRHILYVQPSRMVLYLPPLRTSLPMPPHLVLYPYEPGPHLPHAVGPEHSRWCGHDGSEYPVPTLLGAVCHSPWLMAEQAHALPV